MQSSENLDFLEELQLIGNKLESIDLSDSNYLLSLRLGENNFSRIDLQSTPRVDYLVLKNNPIAEILNLDKLTNLKRLFIGSTNISNLNVSMLENFVFLEAPGGSNLSCVQVSQNQLDNLVSSWALDEGVNISLNCD